MAVSIPASARRTCELGNRDSTVLENGKIRVMVDDQGSMVPELSLFLKHGSINAHWLPYFRSNSGKPYKESEHGSFWKANLLYHIAGNFPCIPNFGSGHTLEGINMPAHGWTANMKWNFVKQGIHEESGSVWVLSRLKSPEKSMPLSFSKIDALIPGQNVHYTSIKAENGGDRDMEICAAWHNTVGAPFLQAGCRLSGAAAEWTTPPKGGEFDTTTRLAMNRQFKSLSSVPLAGGGKADLSLVPPPIGYTDFVSGAIPASAHTGWSALVNPFLKLVYVCFFTGQAAAAEDDIILRFNEIWMQYGGRPFTPWAPYEGGTDMSYCLGTENAAAAYAYGLEFSRKVKQVLDTPTTVLIPARGSKVLRYGTLFAPYSGTAIEGGINSVTAEKKGLVCAGSGGSQRFSADPSFSVLKSIESGAF